MSAVNLVSLVAAVLALMLALATVIENKIYGWPKDSKPPKTLFVAHWVCVWPFELCALLVECIQRLRRSGKGRS